MKHDVIIIGGGPSGMMAAGRAGELGARVLLLEKNRELGVKLLITGKGRCNITHNETDMKKFIEAFGNNGKFLFSVMFKFGVEETMDFFESRGVKTKVERGNRIFPFSDRSQDILKCLMNYMRESNVDIETNSEVKKFVSTSASSAQVKKIGKVILTNGKEFTADKFIICTGGRSYPVTGSTGDGYKWLKGLGHTIAKPQPALSPIIVKEKFIKDLEGLSLKNVEISVYSFKSPLPKGSTAKRGGVLNREEQEKTLNSIGDEKIPHPYRGTPFTKGGLENKEGNYKKIDSRFGEALFTDRGMSGPIILDMSKKINEELPCYIQIDFKPALSFQELDRRVQRDFQEMNNKMFKNSLDKLLPKKLISVIIELSEIDPDKKVNLITKEERKRLLHLLKEFKLEVRELLGFSKAIVTTGGVDLKEIDPKTMRSKLVDNLYLCGEVLDLDGPTGGYNLQVCWSTGFVAGEGVFV